jgi:hypothetical protein
MFPSSLGFGSCQERSISKGETAVAESELGGSGTGAAAAAPTNPRYVATLNNQKRIRIEPFKVTFCALPRR